MNNNQNLVLIGNKQYELSSPTSHEYKKLMIQSFGDEYVDKEEFKLNVTLNSNSVDGYFIELLTNITNPFKVEVYDEKEKKLLEDMGWKEEDMCSDDSHIEIEENEVNKFKN